MDIMKIIDQAKDICLNPAGTIKKLKDKKVTKNDIIIYLAVVGFPTFLGVLIGYGVLLGGTGFFGWGFGLAILQYILSIGGVIVFGYVFNALAPSFKTKSNLMQAVKLVSYAATPWLLLGIVYIWPPAGAIVFLGGLYGLYILYLGIPILMGTPKDQHLVYLIVGIIAYFVIMVIIWWIIGAIWASFVWHSYYGPYSGPHWWYP
jgi:hypothetical protein